MQAVVLPERQRGMSKPTTKRAVRILKHLGTVPCVAACTACSMQFTAPLSTLPRVTDAQPNLQEQFDRHKFERTGF